MDYFQILVVYSRGMYNFMGMILVAQVSFIFSLLRILFKNWFQILAIFQPYCGERDLHIKESTTCKWMCEMNRGIANLGHPLWGSQSMQEIASGMRNFCLSSLEMLIPALTACSIKDVPDLQWMPLIISHTHVHLVLSVWRSLSPQ